MLGFCCPGVKGPGDPAALSPEPPGGHCGCHVCPSLWRGSSGSPRPVSRLSWVPASESWGRWSGTTCSWTAGGTHRLRRGLCDGGRPCPIGRRPAWVGDRGPRGLGTSQRAACGSHVAPPRPAPAGHPGPLSQPVPPRRSPCTGRWLQGPSPETGEGVTHEAGEGSGPVGASVRVGPLLRGPSCREVTGNEHPIGRDGAQDSTGTGGQDRTGRGAREPGAAAASSAHRRVAAGETGQLPRG